MAGRYASFVVRCWRLAGGARRIEVEHVQSGGRTRVASVADALAWIGVRTDSSRSPGPPPGTPETTPAAPEAPPPAAASPPRPATKARSTKT